MYSGITGRFADPQAVATHFHLREGDVVADFGAGAGHYLKPLADAVGKNGKVYLCEIQKNLVEALGVQALELRLQNVHPIWCDFEVLGGTKLKDGTLDAGLLSNTLFQVIDKAQTLKEIARVLRKGAKLFIIDWTDSFSGLGPKPESIVTEAEAKKLVEEAGFTIDRPFPTGEHHYGLACRRN